jgi:hypothetical protein
MTVLTQVTRNNLEVNSGPINEREPGCLSVSNAIIRATVPTAVANVASVQFRYLGQVEHPEPAQSGTVYNQIGLMLRAANPCNLIYIMWGRSPREELLLQVKRNSNQSTSAQCKGNGYHTIASTPIPGFAVGEMHELTAEVGSTADGDAVVRVWIDWQEVMRSNIPAAQLGGIFGSPGIRCDNGIYEFRYSVGQS